MKKLWISILVLALVGGCVQKPQEVKQPEEPVVEEPTITPEEEEQEQEPDQNKENLVKKIDETKDWVYIEETYHSDMDYVYKDSKDIILSYEYTSGNEFENWFSTFTTFDPIVQDFSINIDTPEIKEINQWVDEEVQTRLTIPKSAGQQVFKMKAFVNDQLLSVIIQSGSFLPQAGEGDNRKYIIYNIDLKTGDLLSNEECLSLINIDDEQLNAQILDVLTEDIREQCDYSNLKTPCYDWLNGTGNITLNKYMFFAENRLNIMWSCLDDQGVSYYRQLIF